MYIKLESVARASLFLVSHPGRRPGVEKCGKEINKVKRGTANVEKDKKRRKKKRSTEKMRERERIRWAGCSANGRDSIAVELESPPSRFPLQLELVDVHGELLVAKKKGPARVCISLPSL